MSMTLETKGNNWGVSVDGWLRFRTSYAIANAFAVGAQRENPDAVVLVQWRPPLLVGKSRASRYSPPKNSGPHKPVERKGDAT